LALAGPSAVCDVLNPRYNGIFTRTKRALLKMEKPMENVRWQDWLIFLLSLWLLASPWVLDYSLYRTVTGNACGMGAALGIFNLMSVARLTEQGQEILNILLAAWLIASPYALDFTSLGGATTTATGVGIAVAVLASWQIFDTVRVRKNKKPQRE
jgi:SPW repeat